MGRSNHPQHPGSDRTPPSRSESCLLFSPPRPPPSYMRDRCWQYVLVVGGFGESPYLRRRLRTAPGLRHVQFTVPEQSGLEDSHTHSTLCEPLLTNPLLLSAKAASEGSVLWTMKKSVVARATRFAFGVTVLVPCHQQIANHLNRPLVHRQDGSVGVAGGWSEIVPKVRSNPFYLLSFRSRESHDH